MKISLRAWVVFMLAAAFCFGLWYKLGYPQFAFVDLGVDKKEAVAKASAYLSSLGVNAGEYSEVVVFETDNWADRYLQKTLGLKSEEEFIRRQGYELFTWKVRFFKELKKEEYIVNVSPQSGDIVGFQHLIEETESRQDIGEGAARAKAEEFLKKTFAVNPADYDFDEKKVKRYERRIDYGFSWKKKGVYIPWQKDQGAAKLLTGVTVSGNEIRGFYKCALDIPENFERYIENQLMLGAYISSLSFLILLSIVTSSIFIVLRKQYSLVVCLARKWFFCLCAFFVIINIAYIFNNMQNIIIDYSTSTRLASFIGLYLVKLIINLIFLSFVFLLPGLAGEALHSEVMPENKYASFLHYIKSSFYSRSIAKSVVLGYLLFFIFLGMQAVIFHFGQKYFGVWREWIKLTQFSSAYIPFLSAFILGASAGLNEEILFRLFGINWGIKYLKNTLLAVVVASVLWGFGHTSYPIFPVWFRGIEVSLLGLVFGFIYLRYGIIALIVAHYLLDVFWGVAAYILGNSPGYLFIGSLATFSIPLVFAAACFFLNGEEREKEIKIKLSAVQKFNLGILTTFVSARMSQGLSPESIEHELLSHDWDTTLVELAIKEVFKDRTKKP